MKGPFIISLEISTFRGVSIGAEHWYGKLTVRGKADNMGSIRGGYGAWKHPVGDMELTRILDEPEAASLREKDGSDYWPQAGEPTQRFNHKIEVVAAAREAFEQLYAPDDLLIYEDRWQRRDVTTALAGAQADEFNKVGEREQWKWLSDHGYLQDKDWVHGA